MKSYKIVGGGAPKKPSLAQHPIKKRSKAIIGLTSCK